MYRMLSSPPVAYRVYVKCLELECGAGAADIGKEKIVRLRDLYEKAVREHGSSKVGK